MKVVTDDEIRQAAIDDYNKQTKYDNAYDRQKGFVEGVKWLMKRIVDGKNHFTKEDLEKAYNDAADKSKWYAQPMLGAVGEWEVKEPNFEKWFKDNFPSK